MSVESHFEAGVSGLASKELKTSRKRSHELAAGIETGPCKGPEAREREGIRTMHVAQEHERKLSASRRGETWLWFGTHRILGEGGKNRTQIQVG